MGGEITGSEKYIAMVVIGGLMALYGGFYGLQMLLFGLEFGYELDVWLGLIGCCCSLLGLVLLIFGARELLKPSDKHRYYPAYMPPPPMPPPSPPPRYKYYRHPPPPPPPD
ncbi:MAG: hypothetical protein JSV49_04650 [Thermoplasmata archaeon]|nr:MAG: hypothetical protein JSV49_04650 [Thermoplasmata archaeon]